MPGGLIEIVTYGSQDLYLTGTPEITFFKVVYRRHTNFSIESIKVNFDDTVGFGLTSNITLPKVGDLIHKMYLEIVLPRIDLKRDTFSNDLRPALDVAIANYEIVTNFMSLNRRAYVDAFEIFRAENNDNTGTLISSVNSIFNADTLDTQSDFRDLLENTEDITYTYDEISMQSIVENFTQDDLIENVFNAMTIGINKSVLLQEIFFNKFKTARQNDIDESNANLKFAWVDRIGHALIDEIEIKIGGHRVERQWGEWLNIWYELSANRDHEQIYFDLIGNVEELTSFDRNVKPRYKLKVPLQFWFNRYNGLAIPLVALEYHDVTLEVKFRKIQDVAYIEDGERIFVSEGMDKLFLDEIPAELDINIEASLFVDYIYLDTPERRRFAQSSHEYLIDQVQRLCITNVTQQTLSCVLNNFVHPSKELIWVAQRTSFVQNIDGYHKNLWDNYSISEENKGNIVKFATLDFHSYNRVQRYDGNYFNYLQPYQHHKTTPSDGINVYSFSIFPEEHQPSGSANFSRLSRVTLILEFDETLFPDNQNNEPIDVRIYTRNTNILRYLSGMAGCAFQYG